MQWLADYISLVLIIGSALVLGAIGVFQVNAIEQYLTSYAQYVYIVCGIAGVWQMTRQKYF